MGGLLLGALGAPCEVLVGFVWEFEFNWVHLGDLVEDLALDLGMDLLYCRWGVPVVAGFRVVNNPHLLEEDVMVVLVAIGQQFGAGSGGEGGLGLGNGLLVFELGLLVHALLKALKGGLLLGLGGQEGQALLDWGSLSRLVDCGKGRLSDTSAVPDHVDVGNKGLAGARRGYSGSFEGNWAERPLCIGLSVG